MKMLTLGSVIINTFPPSNACSVDELVDGFNYKWRSFSGTVAPPRIKKRQIAHKLPWKTAAICQLKRNRFRPERH